MAVLLFGIAGWESVKHGCDAIVHGDHGVGGTVSLAGATFPLWYINVAVLFSAIGVETYALVKAHAEIQRQIDQFGWSEIGRRSGRPAT